MIKPNQFHLSGDNVQVTYTTDCQGGPHLVYQGTSGTRTFKGKEVVVAKSPIGSLVTVTTEVTPDAGSKHFTTIIPDVNLAGKDTPAPVHTIGVLTFQRSSIAPQLLVGQLDTYTVTRLVGSAASVAL